MTITHINGQPWRNQYDFNKETVPSLSGWDTLSPALPAPYKGGAVVVTKNRAYYLGGKAANGYQTTATQTAIISSDGLLGSWTAGPNLPYASSNGQAFMTNGHAYLVGGYGASNSSIKTTAVASFGSDGIISSWALGNPLPLARYAPAVFVTNNKVFVIGGWSGSSYINTSVVADINEDGTLGQWVAGPSLPDGYFGLEAFVAGDYAYFLGGRSSSGTIRGYLYRAPIDVNGDLGAWVYINSMDRARLYPCAVVSGTTIHAMGGENGANENTTSVAPVDALGVVGAWAAGNTLPEILSESATIVTSDYVYLIGGETTEITDVIAKAPYLGGLNDYTKTTFIDDSTQVNIDSPLSKIDSRSPAIITTSINTPIGAIDSSAIITLIGYVNIDSKKISISCLCDTQIIIKGNITQPKISIKVFEGSKTNQNIAIPSLKSFGITPIIINSDLDIKKCSITSLKYNGNVAISFFTSPKIDVSCVMQIIDSINGNIIPKQSSINSIALQTEKIINNYLSPKNKIKGKFITDIDFEVVNYIRNGQCN